MHNLSGILELQTNNYTSWSTSERVGDSDSGKERGKEWGIVGESWRGREREIYMPG